MRLATLFALALFASPALAHDPNPGVTVTPGTVSMSGAASYDLIAALGKQLPPADMQSVHLFMRQALMAGIQQRRVDMSEDLALKLNGVRDKWVASGEAEGVRSLDTSLGPWIRTALAKRGQTAAKP